MGDVMEGGAQQCGDSFRCGVVQRVELEQETPDNRHPMAIASAVLASVLDSRRRSCSERGVPCGESLCEM